MIFIIVLAGILGFLGFILAIRLLLDRRHAEKIIQGYSSIQNNTELTSSRERMNPDRYRESFLIAGLVLSACLAILASVG